MGVVVAGRSRNLVIHSATREFADSIARLLILLREVEAIPSDLLFSTIQVLKNAEVRPHIDKNAADSVTFSCGDHTGGELVVEGQISRSIP